MISVISFFKYCIKQHYKRKLINQHIIIKINKQWNQCNGVDDNVSVFTILKIYKYNNFRDVIVVFFIRAILCLLDSELKQNKMLNARAITFNEFIF